MAIKENQQLSEGIQKSLSQNPERVRARKLYERAYAWLCLLNDLKAGEKFDISTEDGNSQ